MDFFAAIGVLTIIFVIVGFIVDNRKKAQEVEEPCICDSGCCEAEVCECVPSTNPKNKVISQNIYRNRNGKRTKVGIITSNIKRGHVLIGYSVCCKTDEYNEKEGLIIAGKRMGQEQVVVAPGIRKDMIKFLDRCSRYYKGNVSLPTFKNDVITNR